MKIHGMPIVLLLSLLGCDAAPRSSRDVPAAETSSMNSEAEATVVDDPHAEMTEDERREEFARYASSQLLDTDLYELRGHLHRMIINPDRDDESPLSSVEESSSTEPGPHLHRGVLHAEVDQLRQILGGDVPVAIEDLAVYVGTPETKIIGHRHGDWLYVPVKPFARPYGAYVRISGTLGNEGWIWTRDILEYMKAHGSPQSAGLLEAHAEGIITGIDVRAPAGY